MCSLHHLSFSISLFLSLFLPLSHHHIYSHTHTRSLNICIAHMIHELLTLHKFHASYFYPFFLFYNSSMSPLRTKIWKNFHIFNRIISFLVHTYTMLSIMKMTIFSRCSEHGRNSYNRVNCIKYKIIVNMIIWLFHLLIVYYLIHFFLRGI